MEQSSTSLGARVARLESSIRRDRLAGLAVIAALFATAQAPAPPGPASAAPIVVRDAAGNSATLTATGLTVRDPAGKDRIFAGVDDGGRPSLDLTDSSGQLRESMYLLSESPVLRQFDKNGKRRDELAINPAGDGHLQLLDENEKLRGSFFRADNGDPQIGLYGTDEKLRAYFATDDASPYLVLRDSAGTTRVYVGGYSDGAIGIDVRDASNTVLWKAP